VGPRASQLLTAAVVALAATGPGCARRSAPAGPPIGAASAPRAPPAPAPAWLATGLYALGEGDLASAEAAFRAALRFDPACAAAHRGLARVAEARGDAGAAATACAAANAHAAEPDYCARAAAPR
jgi:Tfp pilus assembly protein PilF